MRFALSISASGRDPISGARGPVQDRCDQLRAPPSGRRGACVGGGPPRSPPASIAIARRRPFRPSRAWQAGAGVRRRRCGFARRDGRARRRSIRDCRAAPRGASARPFAPGSADPRVGEPGGWRAAQPRPASLASGNFPSLSALAGVGDRRRVRVEAVARLRRRRREPGGDLGADAIGPGEHRPKGGI